MRGQPVIGRLRIAVVALGLLVATLVLLPLQIPAIAFGWRIAAIPPFLWQRVARRLAGIRVHVTGMPAAGRPLLLVANHQSWADITTLGSVLPLSFIAKSEVRGWPVFGWLARLQRTVFVAREARGATGERANAIAERLSAGDVMVLFAEGTTSDGNEVLPFKTALFGAAQAALKASEAAEVLIQPVAIAYTHASGLPLGRLGRPLAAWPGNVTLGPHLARFIAEGAVDATVAFGTPIVFAEGSNRKAVAGACEAEVRRLLTQSLAGHSATANPARDERGRSETLALGLHEVDIGI